MAEDTEQRIDCALEDIVNATNQSKHVKSELKKMILESVSTLRNTFHSLKKEIVDKSTKNLELQTEVNEVKRELQAFKDARATTSVAPSIDSLKTPMSRTSVPQHPSSGRNIKSYADIAAGRKNERKIQDNCKIKRK